MAGTLGSPYLGQPVFGQPVFPVSNVAEVAKTFGSPAVETVGEFRYSSQCSGDPQPKIAMDTKSTYTTSPAVGTQSAQLVSASPDAQANSPVGGVAKAAQGASAFSGKTLSSAGVEVYQSVSRAAIGSLVLGVLGLSAFPILLLVALPALGIVLGLIALNGFRKFPNELLGKPLALAGLVLCGLTVVLAPAYHSYVYMTEVPEGYTRVDFASLTSKLGEPDVPPGEVLALDGQPVFIKGYIHPTSMDSMLAKRFVLVPDLGTCCFGGQPPLTHMIEVSLSGDQRAQKSYRKQRLAGTLHVNPHLKPVDGLTGVYYQLQADILK